MSKLAWGESGDFDIVSSDARLRGGRRWAVRTNPTARVRTARNDQVQDVT